MSHEQQELVPDVAAAVGGDGDFSRLRQDLAALKSGPWLPPPLLTVAAGLIVVIVEARKDQAPWVLQESLWEQYLPERKPAGRSQWRNANYAPQAAGCLAGGRGWTWHGRSRSGTSRCGCSRSTSSSS